MFLKEFESWKVYQASSLGDINGRLRKRGNHPFIYLCLDPNNPYRSYGIMLTTKNNQISVMRLKGILGSELFQNILLDNIGFISNEDIVGVWSYRIDKRNSPTTISPILRLKIIKNCNLKVSENTIKYNNYSLNNNKRINYNFTERILINAIQEKYYKPTLLMDLFKDNFNKLEKQNKELLEWNKKLQNENKQLRNEIELLKNSNLKNRNRG